MKTIPLIYGDYSLPETARLVGLSVPRVRRLFVGRSPLLEPDQPRSENGRQYVTFLDLIDAVTVGHLAEQGVPGPVLRRLVARARAAVGTKHAFAHRRLAAEGPDLLVDGATDADREALATVLVRKRLFTRTVAPVLAQLEYDADTGLARRWRITDRVTLDPQFKSGRPIVEAAYLPTELLACTYYANGRDAAVVAREYPVTVEDVLAAVAFERRLAA